MSDIESTVRTIESLCGEDVAWSSSDRAFVKSELRTLTTALADARRERDSLKNLLDAYSTELFEETSALAAACARATSAEKERDVLRQDLSDARHGWGQTTEAWRESVKERDEWERIAKSSGHELTNAILDLRARLRTIEAAANRAVDAWFTHPDPCDGRKYVEERDSMECLRTALADAPLSCNRSLAHALSVGAKNAQALSARLEGGREPACGVVCHCGPNGEPIACGYLDGHDGAHSWGTLPTYTALADAPRTFQTVVDEARAELAQLPASYGAAEEWRRQEVAKDYAERYGGPECSNPRCAHWGECANPIHEHHHNTCRSATCGGCGEVE